jgi:hypothetical protein
MGGTTEISLLAAFILPTLLGKNTPGHPGLVKIV